MDWEDPKGWSSTTTSNLGPGFLLFYHYAKQCAPGAMPALGNPDTGPKPSGKDNNKDINYMVYRKNQGTQ